MRLDKYLAQSTGFSRKEVKRMLHAEEVRVNGELEKNPARKVGRRLVLLPKAPPKALPIWQIKSALPW